MNCGKIGVILDEAHCFNEMTSKRTIDFLNFYVQSNTEDLIEGDRYSIKISSTEILPSLSVLTPNLSKENEKKFKNSYCKGDGINDVVKIVFSSLRILYQESYI